MAQSNQQRSHDPRLAVERHEELVTIEVEADGFLYNMVRSIAGTLVLVGSGKRPEGWVADVLAAESRVEAGPTAPPQGLFLIGSVIDKRRRLCSCPGEIGTGLHSVRKHPRCLTAS